MDHDGPMDFGDHDGEYADGHGGDQLDADHGGGDLADTPGEQDAAAGHPDGDQLDGHGYDEHGYEPDDTSGGEHGVGLEFNDLSDEYGHGDGGHDAADEQHTDVDEPAGDHAEPVPGAEPDLDLVGDDPHWAAEDPFPPQLDVGEPPEPVDGFPWSDPAVLGEQHDTAADTPGPVTSAPPPSDLLDYDAQELPDGADPWHALAGSEDPATSSLARWWGPGA
ncbi:hypothetical protein [Actinocatenispora rupis]|uniref:Uncharacterized protein n=1 Tax=Actinocatenispora rupis TaxID=519421 RepID=A0A8J3J5U3_9ACTN|nr:hypothetical protein [Actinocatenispora rupis]GID12640.1 hypothetical protein Aru02nite_35290 [Actinocatenispora rupis]